MSTTYITAQALITEAQALAGKNTYAQVDCIRVVTIPLKNHGKSYPYTGSNYFARYAVRNLARLTSEAQLSPGRVVFRSREPTEPGYALPDRYKQGGSLDAGDYRDYHHIGLWIGNGQYVDSNKSATQDGPAVGTGWKSWEWVADVEAVEYGADYGTEGGTPTMQTGYIVMGIGTVNMRQGPGASYKLAPKNPRIPEGAEVTVISEDSGWAKVQYNGETGFVSSQYIAADTGATAPQPAADTVTLPLSRAAAKELYEALEAFFDA